MQTQVAKYVFFVAVIISSFAALTILPDFTIQINNDYKLEWKGLRSLGISEFLFNFTQGRGIFPGSRVELSVDESTSSPEQINTDFAADQRAVAARLSLINSITNVELAAKHGVIDNTQKSFVFDFPAFISSPTQLARDLTRKGPSRIITAAADSKAPVTDAEKAAASSSEASLLELYFPGYKVANSNLTTVDIVNFTIGSSPSVTTPVLKTKFAESSRDRLKQAFATAQYDSSTGQPLFPMVILVDGFPEFWALHPDMYGLAQDNAFPLDVTWVPVNRSDRLNLAISVATILGPEVGLTYNEQSNTPTASTYATEGLLNLIVVMAIGLITIVVLNMRSFGKRLPWQFLAAVGMTTLWTLSIAKLGTLQLDQVAVASFIILLGITITILRAEFKLDKKPTNPLLVYSLVLLLTGLLGTQLPSAKIGRGFELMVLFAVVLLAANWLIVKPLQVILRERDVA